MSNRAERVGASGMSRRRVLGVVAGWAAGAVLSGCKADVWTAPSLKSDFVPDTGEPDLSGILAPALLDKKSSGYDPTAANLARAIAVRRQQAANAIAQAVHTAMEHSGTLPPGMARLDPLAGSGNEDLFGVVSTAEVPGYWWTTTFGKNAKRGTVASVVVGVSDKPVEDLSFVGGSRLLLVQRSNAAERSDWSLADLTNRFSGYQVPGWPEQQAYDAAPAADVHTLHAMNVWEANALGLMVQRAPNLTVAEAADGAPKR